MGHFGAEVPAPVRYIRAPSDPPLLPARSQRTSDQAGARSTARNTLQKVYVITVTITITVRRRRGGPYRLEPRLYSPRLAAHNRLLTTRAFWARVLKPGDRA